MRAPIAAAPESPGRRSDRSRGLTGEELLVSACYAIAAYALFRLFEAEARRRASLEQV